MTDMFLRTALELADSLWGDIPGNSVFFLFTLLFSSFLLLMTCQYSPHLASISLLHLVFCLDQGPWEL